MMKILKLIKIPADDNYKDTIKLMGGQFCLIKKNHKIKWRLIAPSRFYPYANLDGCYCFNDKRGKIYVVKSDNYIVCKNWDSIVRLGSRLKSAQHSVINYENIEIN